ncbi:hypothetical protein [Brachyspira pulli]|uniref:hypothetical protein n=1 Tax=Brachyspira pulli TaxID=310721 RepID=UPI003004EE2D
MIKKLSILILSMIMIISCSKNNPNDPNNGGTTPELPTTSVNFDEVYLKVYTYENTVPEFQFIKDNGITTNYKGEQEPYKREWVQKNDGTNTYFSYIAPDYENTNESAIGATVVGNAEVYAYRGINPFKKQNDSEIEKQFYFYRLAGKAGGWVDIDNFLIAVDTKTGYVFPYAVPEKWGNAVFAWAPSGWISAELGYTMSYPSNPVSDTPESQKIDFPKYKFWQYDPIGKVNDDGTVTLEKFYTDGLKAHDYRPRYTGISPYKDIK